MIGHSTEGNRFIYEVKKYANNRRYLLGKYVIQALSEATKTREKDRRCTGEVVFLPLYLKELILTLDTRQFFSFYL